MQEMDIARQPLPETVRYVQKLSSAGQQTALDGAEGGSKKTISHCSHA